MDYKYIEQLMERYWDAETTLEEESILRTFFSQRDIPTEMEQWRALFNDDACSQTLGDDFDARLMLLIQEEQAIEQSDDKSNAAKARKITISQRLMPLFKAAAVVAIFLTIGGALQAPWDKTWSTPEDYAALQRDVDTVAAIQPIQAENYGDHSTDSTAVLLPVKTKN